VTIRNTETNQAWVTPAGSDGRFRFSLLPVGTFELTVEKSGFARYVQAPINLRLNQAPELQIQLQLAETTTRLTITADAPLLNSTNAEIGMNFDSRRITELPIGPDRNILNLALSTAGVSQLSEGDAELAASLNFSVNGARLRSNNFLVDGQDFNAFNSTGMVHEINNPDTVAEFRLITNQFAPEYGRASGSVVNIITKSGTNQFHGSAYWFYNGNKLNARSNLDKRNFESAPWRVQNQIAATLGGPMIKNETFFFGSLLRATDHLLASGNSITGVPTAEGQDFLKSLAGDRPQVQALLKYLPPAQTPINAVSMLSLGGRTIDIPLGTLSGAAPNQLDVWQGSARVDHRFRNASTLGVRYLLDDRLNIGGQAVPPGLIDESPQRRQAASMFLSTYSPRRFNELRLSYQRTTSRRSVIDRTAEDIPSIEIDELGLKFFDRRPDRTAIGFPTTLPTFSFNNNFHISDVIGFGFTNHAVKAGADIRRVEQYYLLGSSVRGRLRYTTLQDFVDDIAQSSIISAGGNLHRFRYYDFGVFFQDEWRVRPELKLTYGVRYESPGTPIPYLGRLADQILTAHNNDPLYEFGPVPERDVNNWAPRLGFNYRPGQWPGLLGVMTDHGRMVLRGGYSRTYDQNYNQIFQNVAGGFPFTATVRQRPRFSPAFATNQAIRAGSVVPAITTSSQSRSTVADDFRSAFAEQFAMELQRELARNYVLSVGWVATKGTALFQTVDGNPTLPTNNNSGSLRSDPTRGVIRLRCNCASSIYHSLQTSLEKRFFSGFSTAIHYTWSAFIDDASDVFNPSDGGIAIAQDSFNRHKDRGRSSYDRPHQFTANAVWELPALRRRSALARYLAGGWQVSGFLTLQSGAPFSPLNSEDPGFRLAGIVDQVGNSIRPNLNTSLNLSSMSIEEILRAGGRTLFSKVTADQPLGNAGRNILRADGINNIDLGINKTFPLTEARRLQFRAELYNAFNSRDFGIPEPNILTSGFGQQWDTDGGNRRIVVGVRLTF
jgi:hypothetical protein